MEIKQITQKASILIKKYKFVVLILLIGFMLMLLPERKTAEERATPLPKAENTPEISFEDKLETVLSKIRGAGNVEVMLTISEGEEILFQTDEDMSSSGDSSSKSTDTVTITDAEKNQSGLIRKVNPPIYKGAIIVCQGADDPTVKLAITEAVSKITGIGANCISVLKMK